MRDTASVEPRPLTDVEQILLGLIARSPSTGYELKRFFTDTPAVVYRPSSGTLYPALRRLERRGLITTEPEVASSGRRQRRYHLTASGHSAHVTWLRQPVDPATVGADLGTHLMRFVMAERVLSTEEVLSFLDELAEAIEAFITQITDFLSAASDAGRHPQLALRHGIDVHRASLAWVRSTRASLSAGEDAGGSGRPA
jgi:DNA-binding PadR family transcriptional regulator